MSLLILTVYVHGDPLSGCIDISMAIFMTSSSLVVLSPVPDFSGTLGLGISTFSCGCSRRDVGGSPPMSSAIDSSIISVKNLLSSANVVYHLCQELIVCNRIVKYLVEVFGIIPVTRKLSDHRRVTGDALRGAR